MKFINAKFFYKSSELIDENQYSYWWFLMGIPSVNVRAKDELSSVLEDLKGGPGKKSYTINNSTTVILNNAYICGMLKAKTPEIPENIINDSSNKGRIVLTAGSDNNENSIIPFTVGQNHKEDGHHIDSLWLVRLKKEIAGQDEVLNYFPFTRDGDSTETTHIYSGNKPGYDIKEGEALIGYSVSSSNNEVVNAMNFSGFTVGDSTITISGLVDESVN